jgi:alpha-mannosidase
MNSPQACREYRATQCITPALEMMDKNSEYCFVMENMLNLMEYLESHPERKAEILRLTKEGRMEWGATFNQPYESLLSGEQLVREAYFGRKWLKKNFPGCDAKVYFNPDVPGRALQMQQILSKAGIPYMVISRYHEGFYKWQSPDGSSLLAYSPGHYTNASAILNAAPQEAVKMIAEKLGQWSPYYEKRGIPAQFPLLNSVDFSRPTDFGGLIELWNERSKAKEGEYISKIRYSSARHFFEALSKNKAAFDQVLGERPNLWLYIHGPTHHWAISAQREAGVVLPAAEIFSTVNCLLQGSFKGYPSAEMEEAWMAAIYPDHGWGGKEGQVTDQLFRKKYEFARDRGREMLGRALESIASQIKTAPRGIPIVVFNDLSWPRTDPVTCTVKIPFRSFKVIDLRGTNMAYQVLPALADQEPDEVRLEFIAEEIPSLGYKTFYIIENKEAANDEKAPLSFPGAFENKFFRIEFSSGGIKSIFDKELNRELLDTRKFLGFEIFTMQSVGNGAGEFGRVQQPTMEGFDKLSLHRPVWKFEPSESGPVKSVFSLKQKLSQCTVKEKILVYNGLKRIDCEVSLLGWDGTPYREFRLALPVAAEEGKIAYEVPMGVVEVGKTELPGTGGPAYGQLVYDELCSQIRPREVQNFINVSGAQFGLTMSTCVAVNDYQDPTTNPVSHPVIQPVLLASRRSCHGEGNWYLQEGDHHYRFSVFSHEPGWKNGYRSGIQANHPLVPIIVPASNREALLFEEKSFFYLPVQVGELHVLISTIKKCDDDDSVIIRCFDMAGANSVCALNCFFPIERSEIVNMIEEEGREIESQENIIKLNVGRHSIETLKLIPRTR